MSSEHGDADVVVVGAGLAGLAATLELAAVGLRVHCLEARSGAGGLCSTEREGDLEHPIACNEFGGGLVTRARALGVEQPFRPTRSRFVLGEGRGRQDLRLPPRPGGLGPWLRRAPELLRLAWAIRRASRPDATPATLGDVLDAIGASPALRALCGVLGYAYGLPARELPLEWLLAETDATLAYRSAQSFAPEGGPQHFADALVERARALGATIDFGRPVDRITPASSGAVVTAAGDALHARAVIACRGVERAGIPATARPGLAPWTIRLRLRREFALPHGLHTLVRLPVTTESLFTALRHGEPPPAGAFHFYPCDPPRNPAARRRAESDGVRGANLVLFAPTGAPAADPTTRERLARAAIAGLDALLPGLADAVEGQAWIEPSAIEKRSGLSLSVVSHARCPAEAKPGHGPPAARVLAAGTQFGPPGEHAGAAWLSGARAAAEARRRLAQA